MSDRTSLQFGSSLSQRILPVGSDSHLLTTKLEHPVDIISSDVSSNIVRSGVSGRLLTPRPEITMTAIPAVTTIPHLNTTVTSKLHSLLIWQLLQLT